MTDEITGGYEHDLREAENAMAAAGHPDIALGMRRHSEAQRNMMQGVLVPMFVRLVETSLRDMIAPLVQDMSGLRADVQHLAAETAARLKKLEQGQRTLNTRHGKQIKALAADIAAIKQVIAARPAERAADNKRLEERLLAMERRLAQLEARNVEPA